jgi:hypothetical protein
VTATLHHTIGVYHEAAMSRRNRRAVAVFLLVWYLPSCVATPARYATTMISPDEIEGSERIILTVRDSANTRTIRLRAPWVAGDSVGGIPCVVDPSDRIADWECPTGATWTAPLSNVEAVQQSRLVKPAGRSMATGTVVVLVVVGVGLIVAAVAVSNSMELDFEGLDFGGSQE